MASNGVKKNGLKVLMLAAELTPIAKVGGLGDVVGALPKALKKLGADIRLCIPFYGSIDTKRYPARKIAPFIYETALPGTKIPVYLIKNRLFDSQEIYSGLGPMKKNKYLDNAGDTERFAFFSKASLEAVKKINFQPDIIHANDWHTALVAGFLKSFRDDIFFRNIKTVYTIHNLANQGVAKQDVLSSINADPRIIAAFAGSGDINMMAQGILDSDAVTTVSPTYAKEILTPAFGAGLEGVLKSRRKNLHGILNGIDTDFFNPGTDSSIVKNFSLGTIGKKAENKLALQKKSGLEQGANIPLIGFVSRFVWQKGSDLITDGFSGLDCQFVFLGSGDAKYEKPLAKLAKKYPSKFSAYIKFDEALAHQIYAASDIFLVPSRFEPCGLTQMIAMRYGSVPIVRRTGGLADTVDRQVGFTFNDPSPSSLSEAIRLALKIYGTPGWEKLRANCMKKDFTWHKSAGEYLKIYKSLMR